MKKALTAAIAIIIVVIAIAFVFKDQIYHFIFQPTASQIPAGNQKEWSDAKILATNLTTPWSLAFLPQGDLLVTERSGLIKRIGSNGQTYQIDGVEETSEGGLLGIALHPDFSTNNLLYIYSTEIKNGTLTNKIDQYALIDDALTIQRTILNAIPAATNHNGGSIAFGPDQKLYVTTGDAAKRNLAQDTNSLAGKILRMNEDGSVPMDNPFDNLVWSYGHRNPQGITWDHQARMWSVEHGPSGEWKGRGKDELNFIEKGANYGWPVIAGDETADNMRTPVAHSGDNETWAPGGIAHIGSSLFFAGLRGERLYEAKIQTMTDVTLSSHYIEQYGRLRAVATQNDDLYFTTSNRDGRGAPQQDDDKIIHIQIPSR